MHCCCFQRLKGWEISHIVFPVLALCFSLTVQESARPARMLKTSGDISPETSFMCFLFTSYFYSFVIPWKMTDDSHNGGRDTGMCRSETSSLVCSPTLWWPVLTAAPNTGVISMLLLFDTHAGGNLTDDSFKSHLSINPETSCPLIKWSWRQYKAQRRMRKKTGGMCFYYYLNHEEVRRKKTDFISRLCSF